MMITETGFVSEAVTFSVDKEQQQMPVVFGSGLHEPVNGALWLVRNDGPEVLDLFDDHQRTVTVPANSEIFVPQTPEVGIAARLQGTRLTTGTFRLVKARPWRDLPRDEAYLRCHESVTCTSIAPMDGQGYWVFTYIAGTVDLVIMAAHPSGPGGNDHRENFKYALTLNHDGRPRSIIVFKPHGKELSIHINPDGRTLQDYVFCNFRSLQHDYWP